MIIDSVDKPLEPAREFVMVMSEYDSTDVMKFEAEYYPINGYFDQCVANPLELNHGELIRMYVINIGTTIPNQFHIHSTTFKVYPSGLISNEPIGAQTYPVGPGDAVMIEARWKHPGTYLLHGHGIQEERGNMGQIAVSENKSASALVESVSMLDLQHELQKELQNPRIIDYEEQMLEDAANSLRRGGHEIVHGDSHPPSDNPSNVTTQSELITTNVIELTTQSDLQAPASLDAEIGNALSAMIRRDRISGMNAQKVIGQFAQIPIRRTAIRLTESLDLAAELNIYAYDAYVLDCARQFRTPLLSLDQKMITLAQQLQITTLEISP
jgi:predicted nucleic acid-binding protein